MAFFQLRNGVDTNSLLMRALLNKTHGAQNAPFADMEYRKQLTPMWLIVPLLGIGCIIFDLRTNIGENFIHLLIRETREKLL